MAWSSTTSSAPPGSQPTPGELDTVQALIGGTPSTRSPLREIKWELPDAREHRSGPAAVCGGHSMDASGTLRVGRSPSQVVTRAARVITWLQSDEAVSAVPEKLRRVLSGSQLQVVAAHVQFGEKGAAPELPLALASAADELPESAFPAFGGLVLVDERQLRLLELAEEGVPVDVFQRLIR